jgi:hypothetical protein
MQIIMYAGLLVITWLIRIRLNITPIGEPIKSRRVEVGFPHADSMRQSPADRYPGKLNTVGSALQRCYPLGT